MNERGQKKQERNIYLGNLGELPCLFWIVYCTELCDCSWLVRKFIIIKRHKSCKSQSRGNGNMEINDQRNIFSEKHNHWVIHEIVIKFYFFNRK